MKNLFFSIQIDCESTQKSICNASLGERSLTGLSEILRSEKLKGTFLVIPSDLKVHKSIYQDLEQAGHEVGLHLHPSELGYHEFCGVYGYSEQVKILKEASDQFSQVLGRVPTSFGMGYASCNDHTFPSLVNMGFTHGTCSIPTRILPECASVWAGAPLDIHYAHAHNRLLAGHLDFIEIPSTIDPDSRLWGGKHPLDLRVELVDAKNHWYTIDKAVQRQIASPPAVPYIKAVTHNIFDFSDPNDFRRQTAIGIIQATRQIAETQGLNLIPATNAEMAAVHRKLNPLRTSEGSRLSLDTRGRFKIKPIKTLNSRL